MRFRELKAKLACVLAVSMLFGTNTAQLMAAEPYAGEIAIEAEAIEEEVADVEKASETVAAEEETADEEPVAEDALQEEDVQAAAEEEATGEKEEINIEINQGFSLHEKKDMQKGQSLTYMSNFVAGKATAIMFSVAADSKEAAKEKVKGWKLHYKKVENGNEVDTGLKWGYDKDLGDEVDFETYYDENSNTVSGNIMVVASMETGPAKGEYTFYLDDANGNNIAKQDKIDFYDTQPLNILAVPVTAYYSKSANPEGGGCPADQAEKPVPCGEKWNTTIADVKKYLSDVYPVAEINVDEGHAIDAGTAEYDMCTDDGQKKLWDEACKLQSKNKETGKDKYDIILAFVMYRQDATGCGQGYTYGKPANIITLMDKDMLPTVAHEIAHCYEVGDEYDGGSYNYRVNNVPLEYKSNGRDKVTGEAVSDTTKYTMKNLNSVYGGDTSKYYWLSGGQYQKGLGGKTVMDGKSDIADNGSGGVVYPSLHPYILSEKEFVHFAVDDNKKAYPTLSYMGSGYSGNKYYYFTTSVIWDHLLDQFAVKTKKAENSEENNNGATVSDDDLDLYYDEGYREGSARMVEVSGEVNYNSPSENATVSGCSVDPMFSYDGDLSYIEYFEDEEKDVPEDDRFIFAAIGKDGKVMKSPVDGEDSIVEFYGGNFNSAMPAPAKGSGLKDKRYQDFCEFAFDAEYPEGTDMFVIVKKTEFDAKKVYKKTDKVVRWYRETPDKIIDGELLDVSQSKDKFSFSWTAAAYDENDNATTKNLYTMMYFAPQGDDGDVYFIEDGDYENDFGAAKNGYASFSFNPSEYTDKITDKAYVWIKVSDGVNGLDLYTDELDGVSETKAAAAAEKLAEALTLGKKDPNYKTEQKIGVWGAKGDTVSMCVTVKKNKVKSITVEYDKNKLVSENKVTLNAKTKLTGFKGFTAEIKDVTKTAGISEKASTKVDKAIDKAAKKATRTLKKKNILAIPAIKNVDSYSLVLTDADGKSGVTVKVVNVRFDKKELKDVKVSKDAGVSANKISENAVPASETACAAVKDNIITLGTLPAKNRLLGGYWMVGKTPITKVGVPTQVKSGKVVLNAVVNKNGTITVALDPSNAKKGSIKFTYCLLGKKYKATIKVTK